MTFALWKRAGLRFGLWVGVCGLVYQCLGLWISMVLWVGFRVCGSVCGFVDRCVGESVSLWICVSVFGSACRFVRRCVGLCDRYVG